MDKNIIRIGNVSSINYKTGMIQVVYTDKDNAVSASMPYANFNNEYSMPRIGEKVLVAHMSNGSSRGVVLGTFWNKKNIPAESGKGIYRKEMSKEKGAAIIQFNETSGEYLIKGPVMLLQGIDRTEIEGAELVIASKDKSEFESPEHTAKLKKVSVRGLEGELEIEITDDAKIQMEASALEALINAVELETAEKMIFKSGTDMELQAGNNMKLEDAVYATTLSDIMRRLEALDKDTSARK